MRNEYNNGFETSHLPGSQFVSVAITSAVILLLQQAIFADIHWKKLERN